MKKMSVKLSDSIKLLVFSLLCFQPYLIFGQEVRETWQPPDKIMDSLGVKPGMTIGEAGAGQGYFTFYLSRRLGENGKVYANDISESSLAIIQSRAKRENISNISTILGKTEDPLFPQAIFNMIIMVYVLHEIEKPYEFLENLKKYMNSETQLVIIERISHTDRYHYPQFLTKNQVLDMLNKVDYKLEKIETFLPYDNIYIFKIMN